MRKGLLLGIAGIAAAVGTPNVRAACIPTQDCAELGYKYTSSECSGDRIACPFDTSKFFCFEPQICNYSYTVASCSKQCKNVGTNACTRNGTVYYEACGASKCSSEQTCNNGTCVSPVAKSGWCCGYSGCGYSGTSHSNDSYCQRNYGESCYKRCMRYYPDCNDMQASCRASGGTPVFQFCDSPYYVYYAYFACQ